MTRYPRWLHRSTEDVAGVHLATGSLPLHFLGLSLASSLRYRSARGSARCRVALQHPHSIALRDLRMAFERSRLGLEPRGANERSANTAPHVAARAGRWLF